ncbi:MAG: methyltransferase [Candidatus Hodarchaeota archaeon]
MYPFNLLGPLIILLGIIFVVAANFHLLIKGRIGLQAQKPFHIPSTLVTKGLYSYSRNPIYLEVVLFFLGFKIIIVSIKVLICIVALFHFFLENFSKMRRKETRRSFWRRIFVI